MTKAHKTTTAQERRQKSRALGKAVKRLLTDGSIMEQVNNGIEKARLRLLDKALTGRGCVLPEGYGEIALRRYPLLRAPEPQWVDFDWVEVQGE